MMDRDELLELIDRAAREDWTELDLGKQDLVEVPAEIGRLTQLRALYLPVNELTELPAEIGRLTRLQRLNISVNKLTGLPPEIGNLTRLKSLELSVNQLTTLPPEIEQLTQLERLQLNYNQLRAIPAEIGGLSQLRWLELSHNQLTALPAELGQLARLRSIILTENRFTVFPPQILQLRELRELHLYGNELTTIPTQVADLPHLSILNLEKNPGLPLPPEILTRIFEPDVIVDACLDFLQGQRRPLAEAKMILVGQGSVGKTSIVNRLLDGTFDPDEPKTAGINIRRWQLPLTTTAVAQEVRLNVWDFGGQEIMHATHQFFLTRRTLYLLVLNNRLSEAENRLDYWLQIIRSFGGDSPVILVGNKTDQQPLDIDRVGTREKYPSVKAIVGTSCLTGDGIEVLQAAIADQVPTLPHVFDELLATWFDVKARLEEMDADYIPYSQYAQMCREAGIAKESSQQTLLSFLHDLGIVLHFPEPRLETTNILNPEWVTQGVYRILNSHALFQSEGVLTWDLVGQILSDEAYPRDKHVFIIDIMCRFELCYPFPGQDHAYLVPDLLPKEERYTGEWDDALTFQVHYDVLPRSIISRFIVRMHRYIKQNTVWRTGVLLACEGNEAMVRADLADNRIRIRVRGPASGRRDLLTRIREQLDAIHHTIHGLQAEEKVPLPGHPELPPVDYSWLRELEYKGVSEFYPPGLTEPVSVGELLNGVEPRVRRERDTKYEIHVHNGGQVGGIGDEHHVDGGVRFGQSPD